MKSEESNKSYVDLYKQKLLESTRGERAELQKRSTKYSDLPVKNWPDFKVKWDLNPDNFFYAFDGWDADTFKSNFPKGLILGVADISEIVKNLTIKSDRTINISNSSDALVIAYWAEGNKMTPPFIEISNLNGKLLISGGNHRFAVCRAMKVKKVKFLADPEYKECLNQLLDSVQWVSQ